MRNGSHMVYEPDVPVNKLNTPSDVRIMVALDKRLEGLALAVLRFHLYRDKAIT